MTIQTLDDARDVTFLIVYDLTKAKLPIPRRKLLDVTKTFGQLGIPASVYNDLCDQVQVAISAASSRKVEISGKFRLDNVNNSVKDFILNLAPLVLKSRPTPAGDMAHAFVASNRAG